jgi:hypothetical protein
VGQAFATGFPLDTASWCDPVGVEPRGGSSSADRSASASSAAWNKSHSASGRGQFSQPIRVGFSRKKQHRHWRGNSRLLHFAPTGTMSRGRPYYRFPGRETPPDRLCCEGPDKAGGRAFFTRRRIADDHCRPSRDPTSASPGRLPPTDCVGAAAAEQRVGDVHPSTIGRFCPATWHCPGGRVRRATRRAEARSCRRRRLR